MSSADHILGALLESSNFIIFVAKPALANGSPYSKPTGPIAPILSAIHKILTFWKSFVPGTESYISPTSPMVPSLSFHVQSPHHSNTSYSEYVIVPSTSFQSKSSL